MFFSVLRRNPDASILLLRIAVAATFLAHGTMKWTNFAGQPVLMQILGVVEPLAGAAVLLGILARWAALALAIVMLGAIYLKITAMGVGFTGPGMGWEFDLLLLAASVVIMTMGSGKYSAGKLLGWAK